MSKFKGIVLAGGSGTRLHPITLGVSKQLLPIYDKPMIYYPLFALMEANIRDILIISTPMDMPAFKNLLGDGSQLGIHLSYAEQPNPDGLAQAFIIGEEFIGNDYVSLILGDNIFHGSKFSKLLDNIQLMNRGASILGCKVMDPQRFGVAEIRDNQVISIEEKPSHPKSDLAVTGFYFYDNDVVEIAKNLQPSARNELEITDIHNEYMQHSNLNIEILSDDFTWLDTGTYDSLLEASLFVQSLEQTKNFKLGCLEEIAHRKKWITDEELLKISEKYMKTNYGLYLRALLN
tara:strand:- start:6699 stop:7568 length:870 start_codon:yes stop_codon:yes gene_type:complete